MSPRPIAGIVVLNYRGVDDTIAVSSRWLRLDVAAHVIVVDNGSVTVGAAARRAGRRFHRQRHQPGFAAGNNVASSASSRRADYVGAQQ
jgi:GT2 family glycosyltransferase